MHKLFLLLLFLLPSLSACASFSLVDEQGYTQFSSYLPQELAKRNLPSNNTEIKEASHDNAAYGQILFNQLSPTFMQGQTAQYYLGETFKETMQPRRSTVQFQKNKFVIEHVSQQVEVAMLAVCDWDEDGNKDWLVSCKVTPKKGGAVKTWYLIVPQPLNEHEVLLGTPCALRTCMAANCTIEFYAQAKTVRTQQNKIPTTEVHEYTPGQATITTPEAQPKTTSSTLQERSL
ncbi:MAG: hypothetical protein IK079_02360 [Desulfovibrio sp.]|nr:hypothetical protein [Desulfovibrio sp.]